jgi:hypothetical protein
VLGAGFAHGAAEKRQRNAPTLESTTMTQNLLRARREADGSDFDQHPGRRERQIRKSAGMKVKQRSDVNGGTSIGIPLQAAAI